MDPHFKQLLDEAALAAAKVKAVLAAVTGSPITAEAEKLVPVIAKVVGKLATVEGFAGAAAAAIPALEGAILAYEMLGGKPNEDVDNVGPGRAELRDGYDGP